MPTAPARVCPSCRRLITADRCAHCTRTRDQARGSAPTRGYDADWTRSSHAWLVRFPWCGQRRDGLLHVEHSRCAAAGQRVRAQCTDHIVSLRRGGARLDAANLQSLCTACNNRKGKIADVGQ